MLVVEGLQAGYGEAQVLHDIHLSVGQGQVVTLLGRNGMGKTTTISTIFGLLAARALHDCQIDATYSNNQLYICFF